MENDISKIDELILEGGLEVAGLTDSGTFLYRFTDKLKDVDPELYSQVNQRIYEQVMFLWQNGFISMDVTQDNPVVTFTDKAFNEEEVNKLPDFVKVNLLLLIESMLEN